MSQQSTKLRYFLYARKSSESEDRQVQSIEDQVKRLQQLAENLTVEIDHIYTEAKSAKKPDNRPLFEEMIQRIQKGEAEGILCWQINRLSRNPIDSAKVQWLLQQSIIKSIQTIDREYLPDDNALLFSVESGIANQYIIDLRKNTKRGTESKLEKGWLPNLAPLGYINNKEEKTVARDPERFHLVRKMWALILTGNYTVPQILEKANKEWGFRSRKFKRIGGKELARSTLYKMFQNPFYAGIIQYNGREYEGKHEPMITLEAYDRVQVLLGRKGRPRPKKHTFAFTGFIRCGECGCLYTAETKTKYIKSTGEIRSYTYYHCTRRKKGIQCSQRKNIREENLQCQIEQELENYTILPQFREWALEVLHQSHHKEVNERSKIYETQHKAVVETQKQLDNLVQMRIRELITDEEYTRERNRRQKEIIRLKQQLRGTEARAQQWLELTEKAFDFATYARQAFIKEDLETKKAILMALGQNPTITDGKLTLPATKWLQPIGKGYPALEAEFLKLEPTKNRLNKAKSLALARVRARWLPIVDDVRTKVQELGEKLIIPNLKIAVRQTIPISAKGDIKSLTRL